MSHLPFSLKLIQLYSSTLVKTLLPMSSMTAILSNLTLNTQFLSYPKLQQSFDGIQSRPFQEIKIYLADDFS